MKWGKFQVSADTMFIVVIGAVMIVGLMTDKC